MKSTTISAIASGIILIILIAVIFGTQKANDKYPEPGTHQIKRETSLSFETVFKGSYLNLSSGSYIIRNITKAVKYGLELDDIDFTSEMVVGTVTSHNTGGYGTTITGIVEKDDVILVNVRNTTPYKGGFVTQALTQPHHFVKIKKTNKKISFQYKTSN